MTVQWETTSVAGREMRVYVARPAGPGPHPGVVVAQHGSGVDAFVQDVVHRLYRAGYAAAAPELFHRQPEGLDTMQRVGLLRDDEIVADMNAAGAHLRAVVPGLDRLAVIGHCMGGRVVWLMAGVNPDYRAAAVFYGGNVFKPWGDGPSPFERLEAITCPVIGFFGAEDTNPSPADVQKIGAELTRLGKWHEFHSYTDAGHAFCSLNNPQRFRPRASRAAWGELLAFLDANMKG